MPDHCVARLGEAHIVRDPPRSYACCCRDLLKPDSDVFGGGVSVGGGACGLLWIAAAAPF
jgi:hypothetical protein